MLDTEIDSDKHYLLTDNDYLLTVFFHSIKSHDNDDIAHAQYSRTRYRTRYLRFFEFQYSVSNRIEENRYRPSLASRTSN